MGFSATAQQPLSLKQAVEMALQRHPSLAAASARTRAAETRVGQARAGLMPRATYIEGFQTSDNPVFAFGTVLTQRRFTEANFRIDALNHPGFLNNFQSQVGVEQLLWDFGGTKALMRVAELGKSLSEQEERLQRLARIVTVAKTYHVVSLTQANLEVARAAVASAESDFERAKAVRAAGMSTDADVLSIQVHVAAMKEQEIRRQYELEVAQAALNETLGLPLDDRYELTTPLTPARTEAGELKTREETAHMQRPELRRADLGRQIAESERTAARAGLYPHVVARGMFEADRGRFVRQTGANWFFGAGLRWNVFDGGASRKRMEEASHMVAAAAAGERQAKAGIGLELRQANAALASARQRMEVAEVAVAQAEESLRIIRNRYEAGLATVHELLRNQTAWMEAKTRRLSAIYDQRIAAVVLDHATGSLTGESDVLE